MFEARKEAKLLKNLHSKELFITDLYKNGKITYDQAIKAIGFGLDCSITYTYGEISSYLYEIKNEQVSRLLSKIIAESDDDTDTDTEIQNTSFKLPDHSKLEAQMKEMNDKGIVLIRYMIHECRTNAVLRLLDLIKLNLEADKKTTPFEAISIWRDSISCKSKKLSSWTYKYIEREDEPRLFDIKNKRSDVIHEAPEEFILKEIEFLIPLANKMDVFFKEHNIKEYDDFTGELQEEFEKDPAFSSDIPSREEIEREYYNTALKVAKEENDELTLQYQKEKAKYKK